MDKDKLNDAAEDATYHQDDITGNYAIGHFKGFKRGADWLMQQPLSERLTDEEKEKINKLQSEIFKEIMDAHDADDWQSVAHYILDVMPRTFASIFGADLFKEK